MAEPKTLTHRIDEFTSPPDDFLGRFTEDQIYRSMFISGDQRLRFRIGSKDMGERTMKMKILGDLVLRSYVTANATLTIFPRENRSRNFLKLDVTFEPISNYDVVDANMIMMALVDYIKFMDYICQRPRPIDSFPTEFPQEQYFRFFIQSWENADNTVIDFINWEKFTCAIHFEADHPLMAMLEHLRLRFAITPVARVSCVRWAIVAQKNDEFPEVSSTDVARAVYEYLYE